MGGDGRMGGCSPNSGWEAQLPSSSEVVSFVLMRYEKGSHVGISWTPRFLIPTWLSSPTPHCIGTSYSIGGPNCPHHTDPGKETGILSLRLCRGGNRSMRCTHRGTWLPIRQPPPARCLLSSPGLQDSGLVLRTPGPAVRVC